MFMQLPTAQHTQPCCLNAPAHRRRWNRLWLKVYDDGVKQDCRSLSPLTCFLQISPETVAHFCSTVAFSSCWVRRKLNNPEEVWRRSDWRVHSYVCYRIISKRLKFKYFWWSHKLKPYYFCCTIVLKNCIYVSQVCIFDLDKLPCSCSR